MSACLVVEDSDLGRRDLVRALGRLAAFDEILEAADAPSARAVLVGRPVDALFLDIHLPGEDGFGLLASLAVVPPVVFTTAYDHYALRAFDYATVDYLVKPIRAERLARAVARLPLSGSAPTRRRICVVDGERTHLIPLVEVRYFESVGNYAQVFAGELRPLWSRSLASIEREVCVGANFLRVSRKHLVHLDHVAQSVVRDGGHGVLTTRGEWVGVSRRQVGALRRALEGT